jgi:hypothetical protein
MSMLFLLVPNHTLAGYDEQAGRRTYLPSKLENSKLGKQNTAGEFQLKIA